jgi:glycosyltransferase involved in cell wall biosynthesis
MPEPTPPAISVVMPAHNAARFVRRAVESVRRQTFTDWELVVADDASTDGTPAILAELAVAESRLVVVRQSRNAGVGAARNAALRAARGGMVTYLDADDEYYPGFLAAVAGLADRGDVLVFRYDQFDERPRSPSFGRLSAWDPAAHRDRFPADNVFVPLAVAHRRDLIDRVGGFDEGLVVDEDTELWRRFASAGARFAFLPDKSGLYHVRASSQSRTRRPPRAAGPA